MILSLVPSRLSDIGAWGLAVRRAPTGIGPTPLWLRHMTEQQVDLVVVASQHCIRPRCTGATGAVMDRWERFGHGRVVLSVARQSIIPWKLFFYEPLATRGAISGRIG